MNMNDLLSLLRALGDILYLVAAIITLAVTLAGRKHR
jgi:hypothetical protein